MTRTEIIATADKLKSELWELKSSTGEEFQELYEQTLDEYAKQAWALKATNDSYTWEQMIGIQGEYDIIYASLTNPSVPTVSDETFARFVFLGDLLGVLLYDSST